MQRYKEEDPEKEDKYCEMYCEEREKSSIEKFVKKKSIVKKMNSDDY